MSRFVRRTTYVLMTMLLTVMIAGAVFSELSPTRQESTAEEDTGQVDLDHGGTKMLVAFDPYSGRGAERRQRREAFQRALKEVEDLIVTKYHQDNYVLLDCGTNEPAKILKKLPYHAGAIVFRDGKLKTAIATYDGKKIPKNYATLRWGSTASAMKQMQADVTEYSNMPGVNAEKINLYPGEFVLGNPWILKLTAGKGKTLLDIFVLAEAQFDYADLKEQ